MFCRLEQDVNHAVSKESPRLQKYLHMFYSLPFLGDRQERSAALFVYAVLGGLPAVSLLWWFPARGWDESACCRVCLRCPRVSCLGSRLAGCSVGI